MEEETFTGEWLEVAGKKFYLVDKPLPLYGLVFALPEVFPKVRLLRSYEVQRLRAEGFPFEELDFVGEFWTSTKQSCSVMVAWEVTEAGIKGPKGWDRTFNAWVLCVEA